MNEELRSLIGPQRIVAQGQFLDDLLDLIAELRKFGGAAAAAIGEISTTEAWDGVGRIVAAFIARRTPDPNVFHAHLDVCAQCREHPRDLCATGARLLRVAVDASDRP